MIKKLNLLRPALLTALLCGVSVVFAFAQDPAAPNNGAPPPPPTAQPHHGPSRPNPLFDSLDTNHDGVISADEIANASASLKALLKNGSDHLTRDDLRPPPPPADEPRPKIGAIRPHGPPVRDEEDKPAQSERHGMRPPAPDHEQADDHSDRPPRWREGMQEHRHPSEMEENEADNEARPPHRVHPEDAGTEDGARPRPQGSWDEEAGPRPPRHGPPPMALFDALDANHDGTISAEEIANAPAMLKALLKNGSDHLTRDDLRPPGPPPGGR